MASDPPPVYQKWTDVPDTSTLPPPPSVGYEQPTTNNADAAEADRAHAWCRRNRLIFPTNPQAQHITAVQHSDIKLIRPPEFAGDLAQIGPGSWHGHTLSHGKDCCLLSQLPLYFSLTDSPSRSGRQKTIYFELEVMSLGNGPGNEDASIAIGFCALPYPTWRLPGWERASLAVHSDDGHRYVNDSWGGKDFTSPFKAGDTVGIGMEFMSQATPPSYSHYEQETILVQNQVNIFTTRNGKRGEQWDLHEELDHAKDLGIDGLDGLFDLHAAIGIFGSVDFRIRFRPQEWRWHPK